MFVSALCPDVSSVEAPDGMSAQNSSPPDDKASWRPPSVSARSHLILVTLDIKSSLGGEEKGQPSWEYQEPTMLGLMVKQRGSVWL